MKKILVILVTIMVTTSSFGQCLSVINGSKSFPFQYDKYTTYFYLDGSVDVNNAFDIVKTNTEPQGMDFDVEAGYRKGLAAYYAYYGGYNKIGYQNFGIGADIYLLESVKFDLSTGVNIGGIERTTSDLTHFAYAIRLKPIYAISDIVGVYTKVQYQQRPDRDIHGIFEVYAGLQFKFF